MPAPLGNRLASYVGASLGRKNFDPEDQRHLTEEVAYELRRQGITPEQVERALDTSKKSRSVRSPPKTSQFRPLLQTSPVWISPDTSWFSAVTWGVGLPWADAWS